MKFHLQREIQRFPFKTTEVSNMVQLAVVTVFHQDAQIFQAIQA